MPCQAENVLNKLLCDLADSQPFKSQLNGWNRKSPVLTMDQYVQIMFDGGLNDLSISQRVYPIIAQNHDTLYEFIAGSALIPYIERLDEEERPLFIQVFKEKIANAFEQLPALYAFKRILLYGIKKKN